MSDQESTGRGEQRDVEEPSQFEQEQAKTKAIDVSALLDRRDQGERAPSTGVDVNKASGEPAQSEPADVSGAKTRAIDLSKHFEEFKKSEQQSNRPGAQPPKEAGASTPGPTKPMNAVQSPQPPPPSQRDEPKHDEVRPFRWGRLDRVNALQCQGIEQMYSVLPAQKTLSSLQQQLESRMERLLGVDQKIRLRGVGTVMASGHNFELSDGVWTWGRVAPSQYRFVAGLGLALAVNWLGIAAPGHNVIGADFEFGVATYLIAEFCGGITKWAGWPALSWAVNPMSRRDLKSMVMVEEPPLIEMTFTVRTPTGGGPLRIWFPMSVVRTLRGDICDSGEFTMDVDQSRWRRIELPGSLVAGTTTLTTGEFRGLRRADIVMVDRHGISLGCLQQSARRHGAAWVPSGEKSVRGRLEPGADGRWQLVVEETQMKSDHEGAGVESDSEDSVRTEEGAALDAAVPTNQVQLQVRVGTVSLELETLARLRRGQVLDCQKPLGSPVELVVQGRRVGRGELVEVDGRLGVRVLGMERS